MSSIRAMVAALACAGTLLTGFATSADAAGNNGFKPVRGDATVRTSIAAVGGGQVWVAGASTDGNVRLEQRVPGGQWRTTTLPVKADEYTQLSGTSTSDVWLVSDGQLWHFKKSWKRVALPKGQLATAVTDVAGKNVYVGAYRKATSPQGFSDVIARVYRFDGTKWKSLGGPELPDAWESTGTMKVNRVVVNRGDVLAEVRWLPPSPLVIHEVYRVNSGGWTKIERTGQYGRQSEGRSAGWLSYSNRTEVFLGYNTTENVGTTLSCGKVKGETTGSCPLSQTAVTAAVQPAKGPAVLGGMDWVAMENGTQVSKQGRFLSRERNGTERVIPGDPGDTTVAMSADPAGGAVWAITKAGSTYSIQKYRPAG